MIVFLLSVLGVVLIIEGTPYLAFPKKVRQWALSLQETSDNSLRIMGFFSMLIGLVILFVAGIVL